MDEVDYESEEVSQNDVREFAINCLLSFFERREYDSGGLIQRDELLREENIKIVADYSPSHMFQDGLGLLHEVLDQNKMPDHFVDHGIGGWEIQFLIKVLLDTSRAGISKNFAIGITLLNLRYCYGMTQWKTWN